jgi:hypothetical protein
MIETPCSRSASLQDINSDPGSRVTFSEGAKKLAGLDQTCFAGRHKRISALRLAGQEQLRAVSAFPWKSTVLKAPAVFTGRGFPALLFF